jgi:hypothetical protein
MNAQTNIVAETLASAMAAAFGEIESATKSNENAAFKAGGKVSKYADLTTVIDAIKPALIKHGLFFTQQPEPSDKGVCIETILHHANGEHYSLGKLFVPANKQDAQGFGSALTYARRYALVTAFGVPVEDDDGNAAAKAQSQASSAPKPIADAQWSELVQMMEAAEANTKAFCTAYNIESLRELPDAAFPKAIAQLRRKIEQMAAKEPA